MTAYLYWTVALYSSYIRNESTVNNRQHRQFLVFELKKRNSPEEQK